MHSCIAITICHQHKMMPSRDWKKSLRTFHVYRMGNSPLERHRHSFVSILFLYLVVLSDMICAHPTQSHLPSTQNSLRPCQRYIFDKTYPLTAPVNQSTSVTYSIAIISDLDENSKIQDQQNTWRSYLKKGHLTWTPEGNKIISFQWEDEMVTLTSYLGEKGRGMELSELVTFDGRLLTMDDRTGLVYSLEGDKAYPWVILMNGNGKSDKGL